MVAIGLYVLVILADELALVQVDDIEALRR